MQISKNTVVNFHYRLSELNGDEFESSFGSEPNAYLHGHNNIIKGLELELAGKVKGDTFSVTLLPEQAYGMRQENAIQRVPLKHLQGAKKWHPGMVATVNTEKGQRQVVIVKVGKFNADVDMNHPLAGKTLVFDVEVTDVRTASAEEISHGHAHGVGGHQH